MTRSALFPDIRQRRITTNGISLNIAEQGDHDAPLVLMLHGFPESWYSWRHQFAPLAAAGYHAVAPDMRGYGDSDKPHEITAYNQVEVMKDIVGLVEALGYRQAVVVGHDWGAPTAWGCALHYPEVFTAVAGLSVPFMPRSPVPPMAVMRETFKGQFFYQLYFFDEGVAEAELERDVEVTLRKFYHMASGDVDITQFQPKAADADLLSDLADPQKLGAWCSEADLGFYVGEFTRSGFRGPLNYYRNHDLTWQLTEGAPEKIRQPALFVAGDRDGVIMMAAPALQALPQNVPDLRVNQLIPGAGHWTQQEAPEAVNKALLGFLREVAPV